MRQHSIGSDPSQSLSNITESASDEVQGSSGFTAVTKDFATKFATDGENPAVVVRSSEGAELVVGPPSTLVADHRAEGAGFLRLTGAPDGSTVLTRLKSPPDGPFLTVRDVADRLKVSRATVYELLGSGRLRHHRVSNAIRISESALDDFLNQVKAR